MKTSLHFLQKTYKTILSAKSAQVTGISYSMYENWSLSNKKVRHLDIISPQLVGLVLDKQYVLEKLY